MDERPRFVARLLEGEKMAPLCAEFWISRKTGYKLYDRYKDCGVTAFTDRSRRPHRQANRLPPQIEATIVRLKREYPAHQTWHPQQNGRHERMHLTLKKEATKPAAANVRQQQARFDTFIEQYNQERPHQALGMKVPADVYGPSPRRDHGLEELTYPFHDQTSQDGMALPSFLSVCEVLAVLASPRLGLAYSTAFARHVSEA